MRVYYCSCPKKPYKDIFNPSLIHKVDIIIIIYEFIMSASDARFECGSYGPTPNTFPPDSSISEVGIKAGVLCLLSNMRFVPTSPQELQEASQLCWLWSRRIIHKARLRLLPHVRRALSCPLPVFSTGLKESSASWTFCWLFPSGNTCTGLHYDLWVWTVTSFQHVTLGCKLRAPPHLWQNMTPSSVKSCKTSSCLC